jgi:hypothetical protein
MTQRSKKVRREFIPPDFFCFVRLRQRTNYRFGAVQFPSVSAMDVFCSVITGH